MNIPPEPGDRAGESGDSIFINGIRGQWDKISRLNRLDESQQRISILSTEYPNIPGISLSPEYPRSQALRRLRPFQ